MKNSTPIFEKNFLNNFYGIENSEIIYHLLSDYVDQLYEIIDVMDQQILIDKNETKDLKLEVHKIKSSSKSVGALFLGEQLECFEKKIDKMTNNEINNEIQKIKLLILKTRKSVLEYSSEILEDY